MEIRGFTAFSVFVVITVISGAKCASPGYSYSKFIGPVSGPEQKITVHSDDGQYHQHDYVAKPDYHFEYGVEDPKSMVHQNRRETREGDVVHGEYSVLDPDGKLRAVKYTADKKNGFHASITRDGHVVHHPQDPVKPIHDQNVPIQPQDHNVVDDEEYEGDGEEGNGENNDGGYSDSGSDSDGSDEDGSDEYY